MLNLKKKQGYLMMTEKALTIPEKTEKELIKKLLKRNEPQTAIARALNVSPRTISRKITKYAIKQELAEENKQAKALIGAGQDDVIEETFERALAVAYTLVTDIQKKQIEEANGVDVTPVTARTVKEMTDIVERLVKLKLLKDNGGATKVKVEKTVNKIDWNELINQSMELKKKHGEDFDDNKFVKDVINAEFKVVDDGEK